MPIFDPFTEADKPWCTAAPHRDGGPRLRALTTLAGWRQFAGEMPAVPELLDRQVWQGLDPDKRAAYDDDRIARHSRLLVVQTPAVRDVVTTGRRLAHLKQLRPLRAVRADRLRRGPDPGRPPRSPSLARPSRCSTGAVTHARARTSRSSISRCRPRPPRR